MNKRVIVLYIVLLLYDSHTIHQNPFKIKSFCWANTYKRLCEAKRQLTIGAHNIKYYYFTENHSFNKYYGRTETDLIGLTQKLKVQDKFLGNDTMGTV